MSEDTGLNLRESASRGVRWTATASFVVTGLQMLQIAILARILSPSDFGLAAMVLLVTSFGQIFADMGVSAAIIHRQDSSREELSSLYWLNILVGVALYGSVLLTTPAIAEVFGEPRLRSLVPWSGIILLITPFGQQFSALLQKNLHFGLLTQFEMSGSALGFIVATGSAAFGAGVYAIVASQLASSAARTTLLLIHGFRHHPPRFRFSCRDLRGYIGFGFLQMGSLALDFVITRSDQFALGVFAGAHALGLYNLATNLALTPIYRLNPILTRVAFPVFAMVQDDLPRLRRGYFSLLRLISFMMCPLLLGLGAIAPTFVPTAFGEAWRGAVPLVQILAGVGVMRALINPMGSLLLARGRPDVEFYWNAFAVCLQVPILAAATYFGGVYAVAVALFVIEVVLQFGPSMFIIKLTLGCSWRDFSGVGRPVLPALSMAGAVILLQLLGGGFDGVGLIVAEVALGAIAFAVLALAFLRPEIREFLSLSLPLLNRLRQGSSLTESA